MVNDRTVHVSAAFPYSTGYRVSQVPCFGVFHSGPWKRDYGLAQALALRGWYIKEWNMCDPKQELTHKSTQRCLHEGELKILTWAHIVPPRLGRSSIESASSIEQEGGFTTQLTPADPAIEAVVLGDSLEAFTIDVATTQSVFHANYSIENPATSIKCFFAGHKKTTAEFKVLFKILRSDDSFDFEELGYEFFNTDGSPDASVNVSLTKGDFQDYTYSAGIKDDGTGTDQHTTTKGITCTLQA